MALETANNASELVDTNPTSTDLVKSADDHIRMLKRILKQGFQGHFTSLTPVRALTSVDGTWFTYNSGFYAIFTSDLTESLPNVIKLTNGKVGIRYAAYTLPKDVTLPTASTQKRFPRVEKIVGTTFDLSAVNTAFSGAPVKGDIAIVLGENFAEARMFSTTWDAIGTTAFGDKAFIGTAAALCVSTPLGIIDSLRVQRIELLSATHLEVISPDGVGPDNLRYWFGLNTDVVDGNGNIAYNSLAKANAIEWKNLTTGSTNGDTTPVDGGAVVAALGMDTAYECEYTSYGGASAEENARMAFGVDGSFSVLAYGDVVAGSPVSGYYVTTPSSSTGSLYEIKFEKLSGGTVSGTMDTWLALSSTRQVSVTAARGTAGSATTTASIKTYIRKIGVPASEVSSTISLTAKAIVTTGIIP